MKNMGGMASNPAEAICAVTDAEQGLAMLQALDDETALADVARNAKLWEVRLAAAQRVTDSALLERIAEASKHRDDRVYRYSYDVLRMRRRDLTRAALAAQLAAGFRGLIQSPPESRSLAAGQLRELEKALAELRTEGEVPQEVVDLASAAHERVHADVQALRELGAAAALAEALRAEIEGAGAQGDIARFREQLAGLSGERPAWLAGHPTAAALAISLERARQKLDEIAPPPAPAPKSEKKKPASKPARPFRDGHWDEIRGLLDKLEQHLAAGHLTEALEIEKQINGRAASAPLPAGLERQLKRHLAQLAQMRDWAKWGDDQGREQLIQAAEALLTQPEKPDVEALAASVRTLRDDWKKRDLTRPASKAQWERFDAVLTRAFRPVLEFRAKRAAEEKAATQARAALCDEIEAWLAAPEAAAAPFKEVEARRSDLGRRVRALPFAGPQVERALRKRLDKIFRTLDSRLDGARGAESRRREELIAAAEALKDAPVGDAIKAAIALQKSWQETGGVHLGRKDDQALWGRFHAAVHAVFARRDEQRSKHNEERARRDAERKARDDRRESARRVEQQKHETHRGRFERLAAQSALIEPLEGAAAAGAAPQALPAEVAKALGKAMQARLAAAPEATAAKLEKGRAERESLLLDLEIALGIPSPESVAAQRRERQLKALQERFKSRSAAPSETPEESVVRWYSIAAPADAAQAGRMAAIVRALLLAAKGDTRK